MLIVLLVSVVGTANAVCSLGYQQINGGDCFKLYTTKQSFDSAEAECVKDGGHLASVHSINEQNALTSMFQGYSPLIGMKCTDTVVTNCTWKDGTDVNYSNFPGGAPVLSYGNCVNLESTNSLWYSWKCESGTGAFLCRTPFNAPVRTCTGDYYDYIGGCAALKKTVRTQPEAEQSCVSEGGHLASIYSDADNAFYSQLAFNQGLTNNIYIGLAFNKASNGYMWSDGSSYSYNRFANQFPNTVFGDCVQMMLSTEFGTLGQWTNIPCSTPMAYICWKPNGGAVPLSSAICTGTQYFYVQGSIYSPNFPISITAGQSCEYIITTNAGTNVSVTFPVFSTDAETTLSLYYGLFESNPRAKLSGTVDSQHSYESYSNVMKMIFTASSFPSGRGWEANFKGLSTGPVVPPTEAPLDPTNSCPQQHYTADVTINSPNWPKPYPVSTTCLYYITSKHNRKLRLRFMATQTSSCCDFIYIYDGPDTNSKLLLAFSGHGGDAEKQYVSSGNTLTVKFSSYSIYSGDKGFSAQVVNI